MKNTIIVVVSVLILGFIAYKIIFPYVMSFRGRNFLYKKLFFNRETQKNEVVRKFHEITKNRYSDHLAIDYFMKEKGLQLMSITPGTPLILKYYLNNNPKAVLTYFEKVKFHEAFIKYEATNLLSQD